MTTPRLLAPELVERQSQPHLPLNAASRRLEQGATRFVVISNQVSAPPASPADGDAYLIPAAPAASGAWAGHEKSISYFSGTAWKFIAPRSGFLAKALSGGSYVYDEVASSSWSLQAEGGSGGGGGASNLVASIYNTKELYNGPAYNVSETPPWHDSGLFVTITPSSADNRIRVAFSGLFGHGPVPGDDDGGVGYVRLKRSVGGVDSFPALGAAASGQVACIRSFYATDSNVGYSLGFDIVDAPASTAPITYRLQYINDGRGGKISFNRSPNDPSNVGFAHADSASLIAEEVGPGALAVGGGIDAPFKAPPQAGWTWVNQGSAAIASLPDRQVLSGGGVAGANVIYRMRPLPNAPYVLTAALCANFLAKNYLGCGVALRDSVSGKDTFLLLTCTDGGLILDAGTDSSPTSFNAAYRVAAWYPGRIFWLRIQDDGTDRIYSFATNGADWNEFHRVPRADFLTPDSVGFCTSTYNQSAPYNAPTMTLLSWELTS